MTPISVIRAVHHPTRRRMVDYLLLHGDCQVGTLARALDQQVGSISHHLRMLERAEVVERVPERATDGRTSWWRASMRGLTWSAEDFADRPAERMEATAAERLNFQHHLDRFSAWKKRAGSYAVAWRKAAFSNDSLAHATPEELTELSRLLAETSSRWRDSIDLDDGQDREPVFWFAHGFPIQP